MAKRAPEVTLVETTVRGKRVKVDPVEWIRWEFERSGHTDRLLHALLENLKVPQLDRPAPPTSHV